MIPIQNKIFSSEDTNTIYRDNLRPQNIHPALLVCLNAFSQFNLQFTTKEDVISLLREVLSGNYEEPGFFVSKSTERTLKFGKKDRVYLYNRENSQKIGHIKRCGDRIFFILGNRGVGDCKIIENIKEKDFAGVFLNSESNRQETLKISEKDF